MSTAAILDPNPNPVCLSYTSHSRTEVLATGLWQAEEMRDEGGNSNLEGRRELPWSCRKLIPAERNAFGSILFQIEDAVGTSSSLRRED